MSEDQIKIGELSFPLKPVQIWAESSEDEQGEYLEVNLLADSEDPTTSGFALNCLVFRNLKSRSDLVGYKFALNPDSDDPENELGESVVVELGGVLELEDLQLAFGEIRDPHIDVVMGATCCGPDSTQRKMQASFSARFQD